MVGEERVEHLDALQLLAALEVFIRAATLSASTPTTGPSRSTAGSPESRSARIASSVRGQGWDWTIVVIAILRLCALAWYAKEKRCKV